MAADTSGSGGFMMKHGEKLGLGVAGAVLVGFAGYAYGLSHDQETFDDAETTLQAVEETKGDYPERKAQYESLAAARAPMQEWEDLGAGSSMPAWAGNYPTRIEVKERTEVIKPKTTVDWIVPDITFTQTRVDLTGVTFEYELSEIREVPTGDNQIKAAAITGYDLQRKTLSGPKSGDWETLAEGSYENGSVTEGEKETERIFLRVKDPTIDPKTKYAYRIRVLGESKDARKDKLIGRLSSEKEVRTRGDFRVEPQGIVTIGEAPPQVQMVIYKFDRKYGRELMLRLPHLEGDRIGVIVKDDITGEIQTLHTARDPRTNKPAVYESGKRLPPIDFNTGARIKSLELAKDPGLVKRVCDRVVEGGSLVCRGCRELPVPYPSNLIVITDDEGVDQDWWSPALPTIKDDVCEEHARPPEEKSTPDGE